MVPDNNLEQQEEEAIEEGVSFSELLPGVVEITGLSDEEIEALEGEEVLDESLSEDFVTEVQLEAVSKLHTPATEKMSIRANPTNQSNRNNPSGLWQIETVEPTNQSLDSFIQEKIATFRQPKAPAQPVIEVGEYEFTFKKSVDA